MQKKYMILCVAGQSNAVGYDESVIPADYSSRFDTGRIFQLGLYSDDNLKEIPLGPCAQNFQDMRPFGHPDNPGVGTRGIHLPLAHRLLQKFGTLRGVFQASTEELQQVEDIVNGTILMGDAVITEELPIEEAKKNEEA